MTKMLHSGARHKKSSNYIHFNCLPVNIRIGLKKRQRISVNWQTRAAHQPPSVVIQNIATAKLINRSAVIVTGIAYSKPYLSNL